MQHTLDHNPAARHEKNLTRHTYGEQIFAADFLKKWHPTSLEKQKAWRDVMWCDVTFNKHCCPTTTTANNSCLKWDMFTPFLPQATPDLQTLLKIGKDGTII